ncbi:MAG: (2Fe-2S)-binding protein [Myxococcales bacterium]|nr:(2Fe-2S)-binding protein [Myxococcales bacterium]
MPPVVTFLPDGGSLVVREGTTLLAAVLRAGRPIGYSCRGRGVCVACRLLVEGDVAPIEPAEAALLARLDDPEGFRIACLCRVRGDCRVRATYW